jgi:hypothetical protein
MGVWYTLLLVLLEKPHKSLSYSLRLGAVTGMVIGTKYSGLFYIIPVIFIYRKVIVSVLGNFKRFIAFLIPFAVFGLSWYLRNYLVAGNPIYPMSIFGMPGIEPYAFALQTWGEAIIGNPFTISVAMLSEWGLWSFGFLLVPFYFRSKNLQPLFLIGTANIFVFLLLPAGLGYPMYVSNLRYAVSSIVPLILSAFMYLKTKGWEKYVAVAAFAQVLFSVRVAYHPKLLIMFIPLSLFIFFPELVRNKIVYRKRN